MTRAAALACSLAFGLSLPPASFAQSRASSRLEEDISASRSHDSDRDGALIGGAVGAMALGLYWSRADCCASLGLVYGIVIGGLAGMVVGGLVDASDAFESEASKSPSPPAPDPSSDPPGDSPGAAGEDPGSARLRSFAVPAGPVRPGLRDRADAVAPARLVPGGAILPAGLAPVAAGPAVQPASRRADLYGAIVGGLLLGYLTNMAYCGISDTECGLSLKVMAPGMLIGGILGAGIGSALAGEDDEPEENDEEPEER